MITCAFFLTLLLITVFGSKIEEDGANVHKSKESALCNCTLKKIRESGSNNIIQVEETSDSRRRFSNLRFIKHNYFLEKSHHDQKARLLDVLHAVSSHYAFRLHGGLILNTRNCVEVPIVRAKRWDHYICLDSAVRLHYFISSTISRWVYCKESSLAVLIDKFVFALFWRID